MAKGRWIKHNSFNPLILRVLKQAKCQLTTDDVKRRLKERFGITASWHTVQDYLTALAAAGHVLKVKSRKKKTTHLWMIKPNKL